uniref:MARVEL domain-containing protein n=1 Tax=Globodera pallida TaxID=36090 RepID=A0A183C3R6_GLOPA
MERLIANFKKQKGSDGQIQNQCRPSGNGTGVLVPRIQITQSVFDETEEEKWLVKMKDAPTIIVEQKPPEAVESTTKKSPLGTALTAFLARKAQQNDEEPRGQQQQQQQQEGLLCAQKYQERAAIGRQSTGTLNRLILVAQALESEVDWRRRSDVSSARIVLTLRMANIVLLLFVNLLIFTGVGHYQDKNGTRSSLLLTMDKWYFGTGYNFDDLPPTFSEIRLTAQFCAAALSVAMLLSSISCIFYSFACVPIALFIFGLEMHYSACPWLDDFLNRQIMRRNFATMEKYFDTQCGINGWALAGIFSLLSCGLFISDGLIVTFFKSDETHNSEPEKQEAIV